jgi:hypothetical protein
MSINERRVKVIGGYPGSQFDVGDILFFIEKFMHRTDGTIKSTTYSSVFKNASGFIFESDVDKYEYLFKELAWYEDRKAVEMPDYLRCNTSKPITFLKVENWCIEGKEYWADYNRKSHLMLMWGYSPATREEFEAWNK